MRSVPPPDHEHIARSGNESDTARAGLVRSLVAVLCMALATLATLWTFNTPDLGFTKGLVAVAAILAVFGASLALAVWGLATALAWRRAGGRDWRNGLAIALSSLVILAVAVAFALAAFGLYLIVRAFGEI
jgi:multisubunit Na+/H+ antiporter MnhB subunit